MALQTPGISNRARNPWSFLTPRVFLHHPLQHFLLVRHKAQWSVGLGQLLHSYFSLLAAWLSKSMQKPSQFLRMSGLEMWLLPCLFPISSLSPSLSVITSRAFSEWIKRSDIYAVQPYPLSSPGSHRGRQHHTACKHLKQLETG